jgi:hypothetical protein
MALQGVRSKQGERNNVPYLTAQTLKPRLAGRGMVETFAIKPIGIIRNDIATIIVGKVKGWSMKIPGNTTTGDFIHGACPTDFPLDWHGYWIRRRVKCVVL